MDEHYDVVVVGAGLAGLAAGATAAGAGASTLVLDGHPAGGRAATDERGAYRFNRGAHALYQGGEAAAVLRRLGVAVPGALPPTAARGRVGDHIGILPGTASALLRSDLVGVRTKLALARFLAGVKHWKPEEVAGLTIGQWLDRSHLPEDARNVIRFLVRVTTYLHDEDQVSADVAASQIQIAVASNVHYLHGGWARLVDGLAAAAQRNGAEIRTGGAVRSVTPSTDGGFTLMVNGQAMAARAVVLAAGTPEADAALLGARPSAWAALGPAAETSCLDLGLRRGLADPILFGIDRPLYLVDHAAVARDLAPAGGGLVHVLRYLALGESTPADELRASLEEHARMAGVDWSNVEEQRFLRRMTVVGATPSPATGGLAGRPGIDSTGLTGVYVAGDWVGPRGWLADGSLASGEAAGFAAVRAAGITANRRTSVPARGIVERQNSADPTRRTPARQDVA